MEAIVISRRATLWRAVARNAAWMLLGSAIIALSAQVKQFYIGPVPMTLQTLAVLLIGVMLGSFRGAGSVIAYLVAGQFLPGLFANPAGLSGPTGGYLIGFVFSAWLVGMFFERGWARKRITILLGLIIGLMPIYIIGLAWLAVFIPVGMVFKVGLLPFLPGEVLKVALSAVAVEHFRQQLGSAHHRHRLAGS